jgi:hypothetical protein
VRDAEKRDSDQKTTLPAPDEIQPDPRSVRMMSRNGSSVLASPDQSRDQA